MRMLLQILKWLGIGVAALAILAAVAYPFRRDPIGPLSGKELTGAVVEARVSDWSFSDEHPLIAVETRLDDPHSVTTICFTSDGALYVPARDGDSKTWTKYVLDDPRVRVKIGDSIYPARATRITDDALRDSLIEAAAEKYSQLREALESDEAPSLENVWVFHIESGAS